jgi:hypothetical protein
MKLVYLFCGLAITEFFCEGKRSHFIDTNWAPTITFRLNGALCHLNAKDNESESACPFVPVSARDDFSSSINVTKSTVLFRDPHAAPIPLELTVDTTVYLDTSLLGAATPAHEWAVHVRNVGAKPTEPFCGPFMEAGIYDWPGPALFDQNVELSPDAIVILHTQVGSNASPTDFSMTSNILLRDTAPFVLENNNGQSSGETGLPVFNLQLQDIHNTFAGGLAFALGRTPKTLLCVSCVLLCVSCVLLFVSYVLL